MTKNYNRKCLIFFSTCKQVRFFSLLFKGKVYMLHGNMKQENRMYELGKFRKSKGGALFCTDLGARGLDIDGVDVVLQFDCPESVETYVHRVGRSGRNGKEGVSIVYLVNNEERIVEDIKKGKWGKIMEFNKLLGKTKTENEFNIKNRKSKEDYKEKVGRILKNKEAEKFARKYLSSYKRYLELGKKKYFGESIGEIEKIKEFLGIKIDLNEIKQNEKNHNRKKERIN
ncbi:hypothetical protein GVAV_001631 [Gurleya vavrai]